MKLISLSFSAICLLILSGCGSGAGDPPVVPGNPASDSDSKDYLNIMMNSVEFSGSVGDADGTGELQLITIVSDDKGHSDALICPYGAVIEIQTGDKLNPCNAGISYPESLVQEHLFVMVIAIDIDDTGLVGDIGTGVLTTGLAIGLEKAILAAGLVNPGSAPVVIGFLALDVVIGYAGDKVQEYFENSDIIGSQSFILSRSSNWNDGSPIVAKSVDGDVEFSFKVQQSSNADGRVVGAYPTEKTDKPNTPPTSKPDSTSTADTSPQIYDFSACTGSPCSASNAITTFPAGTNTVYISWKYDNIPTGSHYVRYWTHEKKGLWMTYDCSWDRLPSGEINMKLYETGGGLASGAWTITMKVNDQVIFQNRITIIGNENYWAPLKPLYRCF